MFHLDTHVFALKLIPSGMSGKGKRHVFPPKHSHSGRDQYSHLIRRMTRKSVWERSYFANFSGRCVRFVHEFYLMMEEIFVPTYTIRSTSREPSRGREQSRAEALKHRPSLSPRSCSQLCAPAPCSWLCAPSSVCLGEQDGRTQRCSCPAQGPYRTQAFPQNG